MKKQLVIIGIIALLLCVELCGCTNSPDVEKNRFIGTWKGSVTVISLNHTVGNWTVIFFSNGTYNDGPRNGGFWSINNGQLTMNHPTLKLILSYSFSNNDTSLILYSTAVKYVLTKQ